MSSSSTPNGKNAKRLLVLCQLFYPEMVSTGQTLTELCEQLAASGVDLEVICGRPTILNRKTKVPKRMCHKGIRIRRVWGTRFPKLSTLGRVINQLTFAASTFCHLLFARRKRPILVVTNPPFLAISCAILKSLRIGGPYIHLVFDVYPDTAIRLGLLKPCSLISRLWNRSNAFVFKHASAVVVIGRCMQKVIAGKMKAADLNTEGKLRHIHVWSDDRLIRAADSRDNPLSVEWNLDGKFVVGYFGNMGRFHDMETIMEAAKALSDNPDIVFLFVGEGYKKRQMMDFVEQHDLANCRFHTYVERENIGSALSFAAVGLVSLLEGQEGLSVPSKTFGLMAAGVPVMAIMSEQSEIAAIVTEEKCGVIIKPGDRKDLAAQILELKDNPDKLAAMSRNATLAIDQKYGIEKAANQYLDLISDLNR